MNTLYEADIFSEEAIILIRQRSKVIAEMLGFSTHDQTRIATATSEIMRNAYEYAASGHVELLIADGLFLIRISDQGRGIDHLSLILDGEYVSPTGMGMGIIGAKRLMDYFDIQSTPQGTVVTLGKYLPPTSFLDLPNILQQIETYLVSQKTAPSIQEALSNN